MESFNVDIQQDSLINNLSWLLDNYNSEMSDYDTTKKWLNNSDDNGTENAQT